jgi:hypothetical protein
MYPPPPKVSKKFNSGIPFGLTVKPDGILTTVCHMTFFRQICLFYPHSKMTPFYPLGGELKILETLWGVNYKFLKIFVFFFLIYIYKKKKKTNKPFVGQPPPPPEVARGGAYPPPGAGEATPKGVAAQPIATP